MYNNIIAAGCSVWEKVHVNAFHEAVGDSAAACAEGVSPFVNDDKFSVIKDSFNDVIQRYCY